MDALSLAGLEPDPVSLNGNTKGVGDLINEALDVLGLVKLCNLRKDRNGVLIEAEEAVLDLLEQGNVAL
jgi:hypothetical protein